MPAARQPHHADGERTHDGFARTDFGDAAKMHTSCVSAEHLRLLDRGQRRDERHRRHVDGHGSLVLPTTGDLVEMTGKITMTMQMALGGASSGGPGGGFAAAEGHDDEARLLEARRFAVAAVHVGHRLGDLADRRVGAGRVEDVRDQVVVAARRFGQRRQRLRRALRRRARPAAACRSATARSSTSCPMRRNSGSALHRLL